jgi:hypothetical protein
VGTNHEAETETKKGGLGESAGLKAAKPNRMKGTPSTDEPVFRGQRVCRKPALVLLKVPACAHELVSLLDKKSPKNLSDPKSLR